MTRPPSLRSIGFPMQHLKLATGCWGQVSSKVLHRAIRGNILDESRFPRDVREGHRRYHHVGADILSRGTAQVSYSPLECVVA